MKRVYGLGNEQKLTDLAVRTKKYALAVIALCSELTRGPVAPVLGRQLLRSGTSVGANYREAYRARSNAEFVAKIGDSLREAEECHYWLELLAEGHIVPPEQLSSLERETGELCAILAAIVRKVKARL